MTAFSHATRWDKHGSSQLSGSPNPQRADFLRARQHNDWGFLSVRKESGWDSLDPGVLDGLFTDPAVPVPSGIRAMVSIAPSWLRPGRDVRGAGARAERPCHRPARPALTPLGSPHPRRLPSAAGRQGMAIEMDISFVGLSNAQLTLHQLCS